MGSHDPFGHLTHKLISIWLPTTKNQESFQFPYIEVMCNISLESSRRGLQLCFRPHLNQWSTHKVMCPQICGSPICENFGTPIWKSRNKNDIWVLTHGQEQSILWGGRWWLPTSLGRGESCESKFAHGSS